MCVDGKSLGVRNVEWSWSEDLRLETVNITANVSDPPCLKCNCLEEYYNKSPPVIRQLLQNKTVGGARGVAFTVLGYVLHVSNKVIIQSWRCSPVPSHFLSFVIIKEMKPEDNQTPILFSIDSITGENTRDVPYTIQTCTFVKARE